MVSKTIYPGRFCETLVSEPFDRPAIERLAADYRLMLLSVLEAILVRHERQPDYHFIDTKLSLIDGQDFDNKDPILGRNTIYAWIQGRGLEALACHEVWLRRCRHIDKSRRNQLCGRIRRVLAEVLEQMEKIRRSNGGRLFFMMNPSGKFLKINPNGEVVEHRMPLDTPANYSELFYVKGMAAAAWVLNDKDKLRDACDWFLRIDRDIREGRFTSDQQPLDHRNTAIKQIPGKHSLGPWMIGISAATRFLECTGDPIYQKIGLAYLDHILRLHVNLKADSAISRLYDTWEFVDCKGQPYLEQNRVLLCDPGHAIEFVGLALKLLYSCETNGTLKLLDARRVAEYTRILPRILKRNFETGFSPRGLGIFKAVDLVSQRVLHSDMPWWSLPETMRAAIESCRVVPRDCCESYARIAANCSNAFLRYYIRPDVHLMAIQTLDEHGRVATSVPATPDADPAYHTGLSLIDCLVLLERCDCRLYNAGKSGST